jgi:multidrug efflux pump subunit AcrA (membrane-fusion protein)
VEAEVNEADAQSLRPGAAAQLTVQGSGRKFSGRVTDSLPQSEAGGDTVKVRLEFDNPSFALRPDMIVAVDLPLGGTKAVTLPMDALVYTGDRTRVYIERGGKFEARDVQTGSRLGDQVEILGGLVPGDHVVVAGTFLVDSENRLKNPGQELASISAASMAAAPSAKASAASPMSVHDAAPAAVAAPDKSAEMENHDRMGSMNTKMSHDQHPM